MEQSEPACEVPAQAAGRSLVRSVGRGARAGVRLVCYVAVPISVLCVVLGLIPTAVGLGAGRGFGLHPLVVGGVRFLAGFLVCGAMFGAMVGGLAYGVRGARGASRVPGWWMAMSRPMVLFRRSPGTDGDEADGEAARAGGKGKLRGRVAAWFGGAVVLLQLAAFVAGIRAGSSVDARLAKAIAAAERDDPAWRLNDLLAARAVVPEDENSALVVARVVAMLPPGQWPRGTPTEPGGPRPPPSALQKALERMGEEPPNARVDDNTAATVRNELGAYRNAILLAATLSEYQRGRHELTVPANPLEIPLQETQDTRLVARLLSAQAQMLAIDGNVAGALGCCRATLGAARSIGDEPIIVSCLVRVAVGMTGLHAARLALAQGEASDAALAKLQAAVLEEMEQPLLVQGLKGERAVLDEILRRLRDGELSPSALSRARSVANAVSPVAPWGKLWIDAQRAVGLEWMNNAVAIARLPGSQRNPRWKAWQAERDRVRNSKVEKYLAMLPLLLSPPVETADTALRRYQSELGAAVILLAAERQRMRTGQ